MPSRIGLFLVGAALLGWCVGCGDDSEPAKPDAKVGDSFVVSNDSVPGKDQAPADTAQPDQATADGPLGPTILSSTNHVMGWKKIECFQAGCHVSPLANHTATKPVECAICHGGNGACDPNGTNSTKKDHTNTLSCDDTLCHATGAHGFTANADCVACHFASAGLSDCPAAP
jgi:hypothetical protein